MKLAAAIGEEITPEDVQWVKQLGVEWVTTSTKRQRAPAAFYRELKDRIEAAGLKAWNINNRLVHNREEITLNLPGRDEKIDEYVHYLRAAGAAGLQCTEYAHMANGVWLTGHEDVHGARARAFDMAKLAASGEGRGHGQKYYPPLSHGREFSEEELWDNYEYFIRKVVPVAEEAGIRIGIHPDDPPAVTLAGVPRCIFGTFEGYKRALEIADSPNVGLCLCVGAWLEGGGLMGRDVLETIRYFGARKKIFKIHFRNVSAPLPHFVETFLDNGYMDMYEVMKALREAGFDGVMIPDHVPNMHGGRRAGMANATAYMRGLLERVQAEKP